MHIFIAFLSYIHYSYFIKDIKNNKTAVRKVTR